MTYQEAEKIVKWCNEHKWESDRPLTQRQVEAYKIWLRGESMTKICETCKWWHDSACVCLNEKSDKFTEQVAHTETCGEWETADMRGEE